MIEINAEQIRLFRLNSNHLDRWYDPEDLLSIAGSSGLQNSPPGSWESAVFARLNTTTKTSLQTLLEEERRIIQAWSIRGVPLIFPVDQSAAFLTSLIPERGEQWIYTRGLQLALDMLKMEFDVLLEMLIEVIPCLDTMDVHSKNTLDQLLADAMLPLIDKRKHSLWNQNSPYGQPDRQTLGGAVVSFLLRPCSALGLVVFGKRAGNTPTFTSYQRWVGHPIAASEAHRDALLVRKYLHAHGPGTVGGFATWLGSSPAQAKRLWNQAAKEIQLVSVAGKKRFILDEDKRALLNAPEPQRSVHLLGPHDPYLALEDRSLIVDRLTDQRALWRTVGNPGVLLQKGNVVGMWRQSKAANSMDITVTLFGGRELPRSHIDELVERHAHFQGLALRRVTVQTN